MIDATGNPGRILLLGGTSEIGLAIIAEYLSHAPASVVLACRPGDPLADAAAPQVREAGASGVDVLDFDATACSATPRSCGRTTRRPSRSRRSTTRGR